MNKDELEVLFNRHIQDEGLISPHRQYKFHNGRRCKFDFSWPGILSGQFHSLAVEIDGGTWLAKSGHTTGAGFEKDREKDSAAISHGWVVLRLTSKMVKNGQAIRHLKYVLLRQEPLQVVKGGECHPLPERTEGAATVSKNSTTGGAKRSSTRSARKGVGKASRPPTRRPRRRPGRQSARGRRLPKEIEAYDKHMASVPMVVVHS